MNHRPRVPFLVGMLLLALLPQGSLGSRPNPDPETVKFIVVLKGGVSSDSVPLVSRQIVEAVSGNLPSLNLKQRDAGAAGRSKRDDVIFRHALKGFAVRLDASDGRSIDALREHPDVAYVAEDRRVQIHAQLTQPGMDRIRVRDNALTAVNDTLDVNMDVAIAVVDTGIDSSHPDLNVVQAVSFVPGDATLTDPHGHGTHVAGIAAAIDDDKGVHGVAPGARLWSVKVVDQYGFAEISDVLSGLDYVAANADQIDVANLSFGGPGIGDDGNCGATIGDPLHQAICGVLDAGVVVVVSAGNYPPYGQDASLISPAAYDEVITVSAVIETDGLSPGAGQGVGTVHGPDNSFARTFSNYGWDVDIAAPGVDVVSTWPGGGYSTETGTSAAAPHVSGAAAVWIAKHGKPSNREEALHVRNELVRIGFPQFGPDVGFVGDKDSFAEPLLNVAAIDPAAFDAIEPELNSDKTVYEWGQDAQAVISVQLKNASGLPLGGIPGNGFSSYLGGKQVDAQFQESGQGVYSLTVNIESLPPGDYDFMASIENVAGFRRSGGCRIVIQHPQPRLLIHEFAFVWPVMNYDSYFGTNFLFATLMNEKGAPLVVSPDGFQTTFSGGGPELVWSLPDPDSVTGVSTGITYGTHQTMVTDIHSLPLGTHHADVTVTRAGLSESATASFDMAYNDPLLTAELTSNLSSFDFTQSLEPPALNLDVFVGSEWLKGMSGLLYLVEDPFELKIDGQIVAGSSFAEDVLVPGTYYVDDVDIGDLSHGPHQFVVHVTDSRGLEVDSNSVTIDVIRETGPCADPTAAEGQTDADGDGFRDECDNCPTVANPSQKNTSSGNDTEAGLGNACKTLASLRVSSDAADDPDFFTIQAAVDEANAASPEVTIEILPGTGPYVESVVVERDQSFRFVGEDLGAGPPVVENGGFGSSVFDLRSAGSGPIEVRNLVLRGQGAATGQRGITTAPGVSTRLSGLEFEQFEYGAYLQGGSHLIERIDVDATVATGVLLDDAAVTLRFGEFRGVGQAVRILGPSARAEIEHVLVVGNGIGQGIANDTTPSAVLDLRHSTLVHCGTAVSGNSGNSTIAHSILWSNQSDVEGIPCIDIAWSDLQHVDCAATNLSADPLFENAAAGDYRLQATSPLLEHGPNPVLYTGVPCTDLDGQSRLRDHDGDDLARVDPGAYERQNTALAPKDVTGLLWTGAATLEWNPDPAAVEYHVYRAPLSTLGYSAFGVCEDALDAVRTDATLTDGDVPPAGTGFYYEITVEDSSGAESSLGFGTCAERSNFAACP